MTFASLSEAIEWTASHWPEQRPVPTRLHTRETEGVGLFFAPAFAAALDGSDEAYTSMRGPMSCYHTTLAIGMSVLNCPECFGTGVKDHASDRYLYPMGRALRRVHNSLGSPRQPHPYLLILELAAHDWRPRDAAAGMGLGWDRAEALFLMALRRLHSHYSAGPVSTRTSGPSWVDKSDSQRAAETAA
jgi:hypothetical protein